MSTMRYILGFAVVVPGQPRGQVYASHEGRRFITIDRALEVMERETRPLVAQCVVDVGTMRVVRSEDYAKIRLDERAVWVKPEKAKARTLSPPKTVQGPKTIEDDEPVEPELEE